jgi:hypothetical protein
MNTPTFAQMYAFLKKSYKHERFEGRNAAWPKGVPEGGSYSELVTRHALDDLNARGTNWIGQHESATGYAVKYAAAEVRAA